MKYSNFTKLVNKKRDAWTEVLISDQIATPLAYLMSFINFKALPYFMTIFSFLLRIYSTVLILQSNYVLSGIFMFLSVISDAIDGKLSRHIFKKDPNSRGTLDFLLDQIGISALFVGYVIFFVKNNFNLTYLSLFLVYAVSFLILMSFISTKFRVYSQSKIDSKKPLLNTIKNKSGFLKLINKFELFFDKFRMIFHPSSVDSEFFVFILFPIFSLNLIFLIIGILFIWIDIIISGMGPIYLLVFKKK
jgi:phosphatidylglycerophosphate synthase